MVGPSHLRAQTFASVLSNCSDEPDSDLDPCGSSLANYFLALAGLRGSVSQGDRCYAEPFAKDMERNYESEKGDYASSDDSIINEGLILDDGSCPVGVSFVHVSASIST